MQRILSKRVLRDIRENLLRYLALFFLVAMVMYMVVAIVGASETIMQGTEESAAVHHREDGQFGVFVPLTDSEVTQITDKGVTVQQDFSLDFHQGQATLRIYQAREKIDLFAPEQGAELPMQGEILLEQHYAEKHELGLGDTLTVGGRDFIVAGIGSTPDYDATYEKTSDTTVESNLFGVGFVTAEDYEALKAGGQNFRTEDYTYTYLLNGAMTDQELKELLQSFELDRSKVTDTYFLEMLADAEETKNDIQDGIRELLASLKEMGVHVAVLSNKPHEQAIMNIETFFGKGYFDVVRGEQAGTPKKPAPDGAFAICRELGIKQEECLYLGDTNTDMETGLNAGMDTVGVLWGFRNREELEGCHPQYIVAHPSEVAEIVKKKNESHGRME